MTDLFFIATFTYNSVEVSSGSQATIKSTGSNIPEGYSPVAICHYSANSSGVIPRAVNSINGDISVRNVGSSDFDVTPTLRVLCVKSNFVGA